MLLFANIWMIKQLARTSVENELQGHKRQVSTGNKVHTYSHDICFRDGTISKQGIISNTEHRHNSAENVMSITAIFQPKSQILLGIVINIDLTLFLKVFWLWLSSCSKRSSDYEAWEVWPAKRESNTSHWVPFPIKYCPNMSKTEIFPLFFFFLQKNLKYFIWMHPVFLVTTRKWAILFSW